MTFPGVRPRVQGSIVIVAPRSRDQPVCPAVCGDKPFWLGASLWCWGQPRKRGDPSELQEQAEAEDASAPQARGSI